MSGAGWCRKPARVAHPRPGGLPPGKDERRRRLSRLWGAAVGIVRCRREARERRSGEILIKTFDKDPKRRKPRGAASGRCAKHMSFARDSRKGQSPETAARRAGPAPSGVGYTGESTVSGFIRLERGRIPFAEGNAPKGESQERCWRETKPARIRREQTVERVAKP